MRALLLTLVLLAPLLPAAPAAAQTPAALDPQLHAELEPFAAFAEPLGGPTTAQGTVVAWFQAPPVETPHVELAVLEAPAWASVVVDPEVLQLDVAPWGPGTWRGEASFALLATVSDQAPAFAPALVVVGARLAPGLGSAGAETDVGVPLGAGYFALLDVQAPSAPIHLPAGGRASVPVTLTNLGNAATRAWIEVVEAGDLSVAVPSAVTLGSRQAGDSRHAETLAVDLYAPSDFRAPQQVRLRVHHAYALAPDLAGDPVEVVLSMRPDGGAAMPPAGTAPAGSATSARTASTWQAPGDGLTTLGAPDDAAEWSESAGAALPLAGAILGGLVGLAFARRRLRAG